MRGDKVAFADTRVYSRIHGKAKRPDINQLKRRAVEENKKDKSALEMFEVPNTGESVEKKELEMFEQSNSEEDFEIPAFLRRQKN